MTRPKEVGKTSSHHSSNDFDNGKYNEPKQIKLVWRNRRRRGNMTWPIVQLIRDIDQLRRELKVSLMISIALQIASKSY